MDWLRLETFLVKLREECKSLWKWPELLKNSKAGPDAGRKTGSLNLNKMLVQTQCSSPEKVQSIFTLQV